MRLFAISIAVLFIFTTQASADNPALTGYSNYETYESQLRELAADSRAVLLPSLGKTLGERDVWVLAVGEAPENNSLPAILVVGGVDSRHVAGSELALETARELLSRASKPGDAQDFLKHHTVFFLPRVNPDGMERSFNSPIRESQGNARKTDDDRDFTVGEDPPNDLNEDGWITMMRVEDETGEYMPHPDDARVMIKADRKKNEQGRYRLISEGVDDDKDGYFNEDAGDGVSFNRNFPFRYPFFEKQAGSHQVSEVETKAVADFAYDHPNIAFVFTFSPEDNLFHTWKPNDQKDRDRIKTTLLKADAPYVNFLTARYRKFHEGKDCPNASASAGAFSYWAYFHFGRWSFSARGWWVPKVPLDEGEKESDKRGGEDRNALRWLDREEIPGFVSWAKIDHPDFPGKVVEVGGFKPFYLLNPPHQEIAGLAGPQVDFLLELGKQKPKLKLTNGRAKHLGKGVFEIKIEAVNTGFLPTVSQMGAQSRQHFAPQWELAAPKNVIWISGNQRGGLRALQGNNGKEELKWLIRFPETDGKIATPEMLVLRLSAPGFPAQAYEISLRN